MDNSELIAKLEASRRFQVQVGGKTFTVKQPTAFEVDQEYLQRSGPEASHGAIVMLALKALTRNAVIGWTEVTTADLLPDEPPEPLPFSAAMAPYLLDAHPDWGDVITAAIQERALRNRQTVEAAEKN